MIKTLPEEIRRHFAYEDTPEFPPRYNIAPQQPIPIVRIENGRRRFALVRWGLIPAWVKDPRTFAQLHNARCESVLDKPAFRNAMRHRRCLVPADGFYEWDQHANPRTPYFVCARDGKPLAFAGLWEAWIGPNGEEVETAAIITTQATGAIARIHHRVPVIVPPEAFDFWLDCRNVDGPTAAALFRSPADGDLEVYPVSTAVNRAANDSPELIAPIAMTTRVATNEGQPVAAPRKPRKPPPEDDGQPTLF